MMKSVVACCLLIMLFSSSCLKNKSDNTCTFNSCAFVAPVSEIQQVEDFLTANNITATKHCSGMYYIILEPGNGQSPEVCDGVGVTYVGRLTNGQTFDEATSPVNFSLNSLIGGWQLGIPLIKTGGKIRLYIPPSLGYGSQQSGSIPANSILIFDIDLIAVY